MISPVDLTRLGNLFEYEDKKFIPIIKLMSIAIDLPYERILTEHVRTYFNSNNVRCEVNTPFPDIELPDKFTFTIYENGDFLLQDADDSRNMYYCKNMVQIVTNMIVWGFISDMHLKVVEAGL